MKVYEKLNELKGTAASMSQIREWAYTNRILPCGFDVGLELDEGVEYPKELKAITDELCENYDCMECLTKFLNTELNPEVTGQICFNLED